MNKRTEAFEKAREYAFLLLKFRLRSENELVQRLRRKKIPAETIKEVISFLEEKKFIDDNVFARAWLSSRLKRPFGLRRIRQE
ncbi:MAG: regulatory protein RecX, partial [Candidatus Omnitrophota bacterium]